jgi:mRNA interferase MazF
MTIKQRGIYLVDLNPAKGHEQSGFRPVLVMQNNVLNKNLNTVIVAPITSNLKAKGKLTTHFLPKDKTGLDKDSVVLLFQIRTLDISRLKKEISLLDIDEFFQIKQQLEHIF